MHHLTELMPTLWRDIRLGVRVLGKARGFTLVAVLTVAVGIASATTVFSWVDRLLLHPFGGAADSGRLAVLESEMGAPSGGNQVSWLDYRDFRHSLTTLSGLAVNREEIFSVGEPGAVEPVWGELVSGNYFDVLGVKPSLGRTFTPEEDAEKLGAFPVVVISDSLWRVRFHKDPAVVGRAMRVNRHQLTIVGVAPPEFVGAMPGLAFDMWVPITMAPELGMEDVSLFRERGFRSLYALARLRNGVSIDQARAEAATEAAHLAMLAPATNRGIRATILPPWRFHSGAADLLLAPLRILMAASLVVLLIVCANVANLLLARSVARQREFGVRLALGASGFRLARQLLIESLLVAFGGAVAALALLPWLGRSLLTLIPDIGLKVANDAHISARVLLFTMACCVLAALISGTAPALFSARADVNQALREGGRSGGAGARTHRTRSIFVIVEVALATLALVGAGLFSRSLSNARTIYPGFDMRHVLVGNFFTSGTSYTDDQVIRFCQQLKQRMESASGVTAVSYTQFVPLGSTAAPWDDLRVDGYVPAIGEPMTVSSSRVSPGYFSLLRMPLVEGREFTDADDAHHQDVVIVNQAFAQRYFHGGDPIGRIIQCGSVKERVVGLARDSKYISVAEAPRPFIFEPSLQRGTGGQLFFLVRGNGDPERLIATLRRETQAIDPNIGLRHALPLAEWTEITMVPRTAAAGMLSALGLVSLLLASVGLYSVMSWAVARRTQELGVRMALGAMPGDVLRMVVREGLELTLTGLAIGVAAALGITPLISSLLVNISGNDPATFIAVALFLGGVSVLACYVPARRATHIDPVQALHCE